MGLSGAGVSGGALAAGASAALKSLSVGSLCLALEALAEAGTSLMPAAIEELKGSGSNLPSAFFTPTLMPGSVLSGGSHDRLVDALISKLEARKPVVQKASSLPMAMAASAGGETSAGVLAARDALAPEAGDSLSAASAVVAAASDGRWPPVCAVSELGNGDKMSEEQAESAALLLVVASCAAASAADAVSTAEPIPPPAAGSAVDAAQASPFPSLLKGLTIGGASTLVAGLAPSAFDVAGCMRQWVAKATGLPLAFFNSESLLSSMLSLPQVCMCACLSICLCLCARARMSVCVISRERERETMRASE